MRKWVWNPKVRLDSRDRDAEFRKIYPVSVTLEEDDEGAVPIFKLTLETKGGIWEESFGKEDDAQTFLKGVRAGITMSAKNFQDFPVGIQEIKWHGERIPTEEEEAASSHVREF